MAVPCAWEITMPDQLCPGWNEHPKEIKDAALWLATSFLWSRTGRQYGPCPITVRPAQEHCEGSAYRVYPEWSGGNGSYVVGPVPILDGGTWRNCGCGSRCCGRPECAVVLRGPVCSIIEVQVDGEVVSPSEYRVDITQGSYWLVRLDGTCWPTCQNFQSAADAAGAFTVRYRIGRELPEALKIATALLACEYATAFTGGECRLPAEMTRVSRQGVDIEVGPPAPEDGKTGIREVDDVIAELNPSKRQRPPVLLSPDLPEQCDRVTVIGPGMP